MAINADENNFSCHFDSGKETMLDLISSEEINVQPQFEMQPYTAYILK